MAAFQRPVLITGLGMMKENMWQVGLGSGLEPIARE